MKDILSYPTATLKALIPYLIKGSKLRNDAIKEVLIREKTKK